MHGIFSSGAYYLITHVVKLPSRKDNSNFNWFVYEKELA